MKTKPALTTAGLVLREDGVMEMLWMTNILYVRLIWQLATEAYFRGDSRRYMIWVHALGTS